MISTHAPLAGRDVYCVAAVGCGPIFQPTRPLRGATLSLRALPLMSSIFQPTRPLRGATFGLHASQDTWPYFNPRAPCGARHLAARGRGVRKDFNPRAPCGARPWVSTRFQCFHHYFNPRAPCGARQQKSTNHYAHFCDNRQISDAFAQNAACQGILLLFDAGKPCGFWVRTAQVISAHLCFAL